MLLSSVFSGNYVVYWHKGTDMLTARDMMVKPDPRMRLDSNQYNLQIKNIKETDAGDYTCKVAVMGQPIYITHTLEILGKSPTLYAWNVGHIVAVQLVSGISAGDWNALVQLQ